MATAEVEQPEVEQPETGEEREREITEEDAAETEEESGEEQEEQPAQRVQSSETILAARNRALTSETKRHENALRKAYGDDFDTLAVCPLCLSDGWIIPAPPGAMPDEQWQAIEMAAGKGSDARYVQDPDAKLCPKCQGYGKLDTGAHTGELAIRVCGICNGQGWVDASYSAPQPISYLPPPPAIPAENLSLDWTRPRDGFGRPEGHPRYGIDPAVNGGVW